MQTQAQDIFRGGITELDKPLPSIWDAQHYRIVPVMGPNGREMGLPEEIAGCW